MTDVLIVGIVFSFLIINSFLGDSTKRERQKIEAALRMEEMKRGYKPGTYSSNVGKRKRGHKKHKDEDDQTTFERGFVDEEIKGHNKERADLKNGIDDLMTRINNLETIMKSEEDKKNE
ncbi:MAG: hypothetical protein M0P10_03800 [Sphaerochaetaceae bacterium]|nr:hypothetical protein [Sphaerochaetaceae bacterium]